MLRPHGKGQAPPPPLPLRGAGQTRGPKSHRARNSFDADEIELFLHSAVTGERLSSLNVRPTDNVAEVKKKIEVLVRVPVKYQKLMRRGMSEELENCKTIFACGLASGEMLMFLRQAASSPELLAACEEGDALLASYCLDARLDVSAMPSALFTAASVGHAEIVALLLAARASANDLDWNGSTALHMATTHDVVMLLLRAEADPTTLNRSGRTAATCVLPILAHAGDVDSVILLLHRRGLVNTPFKLHGYQRPHHGNLAKVIGNNSLHCAAKCGHAELLRVLLDAKADMKIPGKHGNTALHFAIVNRHIFACKALLSVGQSSALESLSHSCSNGTWSALLADINLGSASRGRRRSCRTSVHCPPLWPIPLCTGDWQTSGQYPIYWGDVAGLGEVLAVKNRDGQTVLHHAVRYGDVTILQDLLAASADMSCVDKQHMTPLHLSVRRGCIQVCQALLQARAGIRDVNKNGDTMLHSVIHSPLASEGERVAIAKFLLEARADPTATNHDNLTPLDIAEDGRQGGEILADLIRSMANSASPRHDGIAIQQPCDSLTLHNRKIFEAIEIGKAMRSTKMFEAIEEGQDSSLRTLLGSGPDAAEQILTPASHGMTLLHLAAEKGHKAVVAALLEIAERNAVLKEILGKYDLRGNIPLHLGALYGHEAVTHLLSGAAQNLANVKYMMEAKNDFCDTPLHEAAAEGHNIVVRLLLENAPCPAILREMVHARNCCGDTPLHRSALNGHYRVVSLLLEKAPDTTSLKLMLEAKNRSCNIPLQLGAAEGHSEIVRALLETAPDSATLKQMLETKNSSGDIALHRGAFGGHSAVVSLLLDKAPDATTLTLTLHTKGYEGETALHLGVVNGHEVVVNMLLGRLVDSAALKQMLYAKNDSGDTPRECCAQLHGALRGILRDIEERVKHHS